MKYICFFEYKPEDIDKVISLFQEMMKLWGKPGYPKSLMPTQHFAGDSKGFTIYEVDDPKQLVDHYIHYEPWMKFTWTPILDSTELVKAHLSKKK